MKKVHCLAVFIMGYVILTLLPACNRSKEISICRAINIASIKAKSKGYNVQELDVHVSKHNTPINRHTSLLDIQGAGDDIKRKLMGRTYYTIYYSPRAEPDNVIKGGDIVVFVDAHSGEIIAIIPGQ